MVITKDILDKETKILKQESRDILKELFGIPSDEQRRISGISSEWEDTRIDKLLDNIINMAVLQVSVVITEMTNEK